MSKFKVGDIIVHKTPHSPTPYTVIAILPDQKAVISWYNYGRYMACPLALEGNYTLKPAVRVTFQPVFSSGAPGPEKRFLTDCIYEDVVFVLERTFEDEKLVKLKVLDAFT